MTESRKINKTIFRLDKADIIDLDIECVVYYARSDLKLGSGYGGAIAVRGGPSIQEELDRIAPIDVGESVITSAGNLKAKHIIHANGPKFQEEDLESKLVTTVVNALKLADERGIKTVAFPPMGTGFYGVPLDLCARVMIDTIRKHLEGSTNLQEIIICLHDSREYAPFKSQLSALGQLEEAK